MSPAREAVYLPVLFLTVALLALRSWNQISLDARLGSTGDVSHAKASAGFSRA